MILVKPRLIPIRYTWPHDPSVELAAWRKSGNHGYPTGHSKERDHGHWKLWLRNRWLRNWGAQSQDWGRCLFVWKIRNWGYPGGGDGRLIKYVANGKHTEIRNPGIRYARKYIQNRRRRRLNAQKNIQNRTRRRRNAQKYIWSRSKTLKNKNWGHPACT